MTVNYLAKLSQRLSRLLRVVTMLAVVSLLPHQASATPSSNSKNSKWSSSKSAPSKSTPPKSTPTKSTSSKSQDRDDCDDHSSGSNHSSGGSQHNGGRDDDDRDCDGGYGYHDDRDDDDCGSGSGGGVVLTPVTILNTSGTAVTVLPNGTLALTAQLVAGSAPVSYQWMHRIAGTVSIETLVGATSLTLNITNVDASDAGQYWIVATNALGSVLSTETNVTVPSTIAIDITNPASGSQVHATVGDEVLLQATLTTTDPLHVSLQWYMRINNGPALTILGATSLSLDIVNAQITNTGDYWIVATNTLTGAVATSSIRQVQVLPVGVGHE